MQIISKKTCKHFTSFRSFVTVSFGRLWRFCSVVCDDFVRSFVEISQKKLGTECFGNVFLHVAHAGRRLIALQHTTVATHEELGEVPLD